ncbi:NUDIX hydrolase [Streptomyces sp. NPDC026665]|uniref:NUDIX hydrolase n=1 Tax=Streptomyces sp. NPDC026665 TaxID=3154798 RepID=UPI0033C56B91
MSDEKALTAVDGTDALAAVLIRPGSAEGQVALEAWAKGIDKSAAADVLRHVADRWHPRADLLGVFDEIAAERLAQDARWGEQNHPDGTGTASQQVAAGAARARCQVAAERGEVTWRLISEEEHAEAMAESDPVKLRAELVQSAAVKVAWIQALDRRAQQDAARDA